MRKALDERDWAVKQVLPLPLPQPSTPNPNPNPKPRPNSNPKLRPHPHPEQVRYLHRQRLESAAQHADKMRGLLEDNSRLDVDNGTPPRTPTLPLPLHPITLALTPTLTLTRQAYP